LVPIIGSIWFLIEVGILGRHAWTESVRPAAKGCVISTVSGRLA
jgi:hypothetical protein